MKAAAVGLLLIATVAVGGCGGGGSDGTSSTTSTSAATSTTASPDDGATATTTTTVVANLIEVRIAGGAVDGGPQRRSVSLGETVTLRVTADTADEVHVHTYDRRIDTVPGQAVELVFVADIPGRHEIELEGDHLLLLTLEVR